MPIKSRYKPGQIIKIIGDSAYNPHSDIGELAKITRISGIQIYYHTLKELTKDPDLPNKSPGYYCYPEDCEPARALDGDHILARMYKNGEKATLLEMGFIDKNETITAKGYKFLETFE